MEAEYVNQAQLLLVGDDSGNTTTGSCIDTGDTTWVLIAMILILGMMPGLAFFEAGLLRLRSTLSIITQIFVGLLLLSLMWDLFGYSFVYGKSLAGIIGNPIQHFALINVPYDDCDDHAPKIPAAAFAMFEMMFAAITPLLMTGSFAERIKFKTYIVFIIVWELLVYYPVAHWVWGGGWLDKLGALDFAGGIVIHTTAGFGGLVVAIFVGRRNGFEANHGQFPTHSIPFAAIGAAMLWMGWFGFNAGSALSSGSVATSTVISTQIAASTSGAIWLLFSMIRGKPSLIAVMNGLIAGLAGITPASGYIDTPSTYIIAIVLGVSSYWACLLVKDVLKIDDALEVSCVHGLTGAIGAIGIGFFARKAVNPDGANGLFFGDARLLWVQALAVGVALVYSVVVTFLICVVLHFTPFLRLRISKETEDRGQDHVEHGEFAYLNMLQPDTQHYFPNGSHPGHVQETSYVH